MSAKAAFSRPRARLGVLIGLAVLAGCEATPLTPTGGSGSQISGTPVDQTGNPGDAFGSCEIPPAPENPYFPFTCSRGSTACTGWGSPTSCGAGGCSPTTFHVVCDHACTVAADCPIPGTGNAQPFCHPDFHFCELPCDPSVQCPAGYTCQSTADWGLSDGAGNPIPLPFLCMQTITLVVSPDGGT